MHANALLWVERKNIKPPKWQEAAEQNRAVTCTMKPPQYN